MIATIGRINCFTNIPRNNTGKSFILILILDETVSAPHGGQGWNDLFLS